MREEKKFILKDESENCVASFSSTEEHDDFFYTLLSVKLVRGIEISEDVECEYDPERLEKWVDAKHQEYSNLKVSWDAKNREARQRYIQTIQSELDQKKTELDCLNQQLKACKVKRPDPMGYVIKEVEKDVRALEEENEKEVHFDGQSGLIAKDRRPYLYHKIKANVEVHFHVSLEEYNLFFNRMIDFDYKSYVKVKEFIDCIRSYLSNVHVETFVMDDTNVLRSQIKDKKSKLQSECSKLQNDLGMYQSSMEYRAFKEKYNAFMKLYACRF